MEKKKTIQQGIVCVVLLCVIWSGYYFVKIFGADRVLNISDNNLRWMCQVDSIETLDKRLVLKGFAFERYTDVSEGDYVIVLENITSEERYFPKMRYEDREDVEAYFEGNYSYLSSGYEAIFRLSRGEIEEANYEILLKYADSSMTYRTGIYISKGEVVYVNPLEYVPLDGICGDLEEVLEKGVIRVYRPDYGVYVYQYGGELYWITEVGYEFENGDTYMHYQIEPTQTNSLAKEQLQFHWHPVDMGFVFSGEEIECEMQEYRVAKVGLPKDYSIEKILTGNYYVDDWKWYQYFQPYYDFENLMK